MIPVGYKHSIEARIKMSKAKTGNKNMLGKHFSEEHRRKLSESHKGIKAWNIGKPCTEETKRKISEAQKGSKNHRYGKTHSLEMRLRMSERLKGNTYTLGRRLSEEHKRKISEGSRGEKSCHWKGGINPICEIIRKSFRYQQWRQAIYTRDDFTCQDCGDKTGNNLNAHHKKPFSILLQEAINYMPLLTVYDAAMAYSPLWAINNGETLCEKCHNKKKGQRWVRINGVYKYLFVKGQR